MRNNSVLSWVEVSNKKNKTSDEVLVLSEKKKKNETLIYFATKPTA